MKFTFRLVTVLVLLSALAGVARADFHDVVFCGDLPAADCVLLEAAQENAAQQTSGSGVLDLDLLMRDLDEEAMGEFLIALNADVVWSGDLSGLEEMGAASLGMMDDPAAMMTMLGELLAQFNGMFTLSLQMPQGLPGTLADDIPAELLSGISMEARLVDGNLYFDLSSLATIMPAEDGVPSGWFGFNIMELLEAGMAAEGMSEGMKDPRGSDDDAMAEADAEMEAAMAEMEALAASWTDPDFLAEFMSIERLADEMVADQLVAVFRTGVDLVALFNSDAFSDLLLAGTEMGEIDEEELQDMSMMIDMMDMLGSGIDIEATTYISIDEALPVRDVFHMAWDMADMMAFMSESEDAIPYVSVDYQMDYSYPAEAPTVTVPENAFIISPGLLMAGADA